MTENEAYKTCFGNPYIVPMDEYEEAKSIIKKSLDEIRQYRELGTVEELRIAKEKQIPKKPLYKHYENEGEKPYIKICCPNNCHIQVYPVTHKNLAFENVYCHKCGQKLDWSDEE